MELSDNKSTIAVTGLWFSTVVLGILSFIATRTMVIRTYLRFFPAEVEAASQGTGALSLVNVLVSFSLGIIMIVVVIGGFEYYRKKENHEKAWGLLTKTIAVEIALLTLALFI